MAGCAISNARSYANSIIGLNQQIRNLERIIEQLRGRGANTANQERALADRVAQRDDLKSRLDRCLINLTFTQAQVNSLQAQVNSFERTLNLYRSRGIGPGNPVYDTAYDRYYYHSLILDATSPKPCPDGYAKDVVCIQCLGVTREVHPQRPDCARCVGTCVGSNGDGTCVGSNGDGTCVGSNGEQPCPTGYTKEPPGQTVTCPPRIGSIVEKKYHSSRRDCYVCLYTEEQECPEGWTGTYPYCTDPNGVPRVCDSTWTCWQDPVTQAMRHAPNTCDAENFRKRGYVMVDNRLCFNVPCPTGYEKQADGTCKKIVAPTPDAISAFEWGRWGAWIAIGLGALATFVLYKAGYINIKLR